MKVRNFKDVSLWDLLATVDHFSEVDISIYCEEYSIYNISGEFGRIYDDLHDLVSYIPVTVEHVSLKPFDHVDDDGIIRRGVDHLLEIKAFISDIYLEKFLKEYPKGVEGLEL